MFDIKWIRTNPETFDAGLARRGLSPLSATLIGIDEKRRAVIQSLNEAQEKRNALSKQIGQAKAQKDEARATELMAAVAGLKDAIPTMEAEQRSIDAELRTALSEIPNLPLADVPEGADESGNVPYFRPNESDATRPKKPELAFAPKEHFELGEALGEMDFEVAAKLSGSRFVVLKGELARLERAIGQFMLDLHTEEHGYTEVQPPILVRDDTMFGTGQLPKFKDDQYYFASGERPPILDESRIETELRALIEAPDEVIDGQRSIAVLQRWLAGLSSSAREPKKVGQRFRGRVPRAFLDYIESNNRSALGASSKLAEFLQAYANYEVSLAENRLWLIPTAEVPLTNLVRESILAESELPRRYTALTPCFRSEAGSAGRDTRGMIRQHQFDKVEMVAITTPENSAAEHEKMLADAENVLKRLRLHYRVVTLCTGDMGFGAQKTYDIEVWLPGQNAYREISSVSVCGDFQARRMDARYRDKDGAINHVHTLNGSGVAVGRALVAVMENYQNPDGSITVPDVLVPYMRGKTVIGAPS